MDISIYLPDGDITFARVGEQIGIEKFSLLSYLYKAASHETQNPLVATAYRALAEKLEKEVA